MTILEVLSEPIATRLRRANCWFVLTGAGISAESGVPTFRGAGGLWEGCRPEDLATPEGFRRDPARVWRWYRWRRGILRDARPNDAHRALARLAARVPRFALATQNVDDLHERAGSRAVLHLHGDILGSRCLDGCGAPAREDPDLDVPLCACGSPLRPDVVWFGEPLPEGVLASACSGAAACEACLVVGTSSLVYPAASLPSVARRSGAAVIEVNPEETPLTEIAHASLRGRAAPVLPALLRDLGFSEEPPADRGV